MPTPGEHKPVQARILAYAQEIGWRYVPRAEAEARSAFDPDAATLQEWARKPSVCVGGPGRRLMTAQLRCPRPRLAGPDIVRRKGCTMNNEPQSRFLLYQTSDGQTRLEVRLENETVWLSQNQMAELFQTTKQNVSRHIRNMFKEGELPEGSVVKEYLTTAADGKNCKASQVLVDRLGVALEVHLLFGPGAVGLTLRAQVARGARRCWCQSFWGRWPGWGNSALRRTRAGVHPGA